MPDPRKNGHHSDRVHQATGIVAAQVGCSTVDALKLLRARASTTHRSLEHVADAVIDGSIRFDD